MSKSDNQIIEINGWLFELIPVYFNRTQGVAEVTLTENWSNYEEWGYILKPVKMVAAPKTDKVFLNGKEIRNADQ